MVTQLYAFPFFNLFSKMQRKNQFRFSLNAEESQWSTKFNANSFQPLSPNEKPKSSNNLPEVEIVTASPMSDSDKVCWFGININHALQFNRQFTLVISSPFQNNSIYFFLLLIQRKHIHLMFRRISSILTRTKRMIALRQRYNRKQTTLAPTPFTVVI